MSSADGSRDFVALKTLRFSLWMSSVGVLVTLSFWKANLVFVMDVLSERLM
jgi:hypothetical protein